MAEGRRSPLTRADVLRLIEENGGKAEGLDLSGKRFEERVDLRGLNLEGVILKWAVFTPSYKGVVEGARLQNANLKRAQLQEAHLVAAELQLANLDRAQLQEADLAAANLEGASLVETQLQEAKLVGARLDKAWLSLAQLEGANLTTATLRKAHLEGANLGAANLSYADLEGVTLADRQVTLAGAQFSSDTRLESVHWGDYVLGEEEAILDEGIESYRRLKQWYTNAGMYQIAGKFFYREMEARRKSRRWKVEPHLKLWDCILRLLCGYGEKAERVVVSALVLILGLAMTYFFLGAFRSTTFAGCLYYSVVSFTALGYAGWVYPEPASWAKGLGAAQAVLGVFMMALFLVTFTRKMTR